MSASYFSHPYCSNSALTKLKLALSTQEYRIDSYNAFRLGTLPDAMITTPELVDYYKKTVIGTEYTYTDEEIERAKAMRAAYLADPYCAALHRISEMQKEIYTPGLAFSTPFPFTLDSKCKPDLYSLQLRMAPDIKTTAAKTEKQFRDACVYFDYPRSRVFYMRQCGFVRDLLIGISNHPPHKIFKIFIEYGDPLWKIGEPQLNDLAFKYYMIQK